MVWRRDEPHRSEANHVLRRPASSIVERSKRAKAEGDLPKDADPAALARYISTVAQGISIQACQRCKPAELRRVVELALRQWPR